MAINKEKIVIVYQKPRKQWRCKQPGISNSSWMIDDCKAKKAFKVSIIWSRYSIYEYTKICRLINSLRTNFILTDHCFKENHFNQLNQLKYFIILKYFNNLHWAIFDMSCFWRFKKNAVLWPVRPQQCCIMITKSRDAIKLIRSVQFDNTEDLFSH